MSELTLEELHGPTARAPTGCEAAVVHRGRR